MAIELKEEMTDERLDYLGLCFVERMMAHRLKISFADYLEGVERYDRIIGYTDSHVTDWMVPRFEWPFTSRRGFNVFH